MGETGGAVGGVAVAELFPFGTLDLGIECDRSLTHLNTLP